MILKAEEKHLNIVSKITQQTINEIYPHYYPIGAVEFFKAHHKESSILADIKKGIVYLLKDNDDFVGTVTIKENEICRLFVLPKYQHKGYGKELINYAESEIFKNYGEVILDASLFGVIKKQIVKLMIIRIQKARLFLKALCLHRKVHQAVISTFIY